MALGNSYGGTDNNQENYSPTVYCPIQFKNSDGVDPSTLSFSYWNKLLKISISPMKPMNAGDAYPTYDYKNNISIHINHMKARILFNEIEEFLKDPNKLNSVGINSGANGLLSLTNGKEFGVNNPVLVIRKVDESGAVSSSFAYEFNKADYHHSIRNFDDKSAKFDKVDFVNAELIVFKEVLKQYYETATYAHAYTVVDATDYYTSRTDNKLNQLLENAGIPVGGGSGGKNKSNGRSFFGGQQSQSQPTASRNQTTLDDLEESMS